MCDRFSRECYLFCAIAFLIHLSTVPVYTANDFFGEKHWAPNGEIGDFFGWPIAANDSSVFIGSIFDSHANGIRAGSVSVMTRGGNGWQFTQSILPSSGSDQSQFGMIACDADYLAVGAPTAKNSNGKRTGCVFVYTQNNNQWILLAQLFPDTNDENIRFGYRVAIDDPYLVVSALPQLPTQIPFVSIYRREGNTWNPNAQFVPVFAGNFGESIAILGDRLAVGAPDSLHSNKTLGLVYLYEEQDGHWSQSDTLVPGGAASLQSFGQSVALNSSTIAVGVPLLDSEKNIDVPRMGAVFLYEKGGDHWIETNRIRSILRSSVNFGAGVSLSEDTLLVSSTYRLGAEEYMQKNFSLARAFVYKKISGLWYEADIIQSENDDSTGFAQSLFLQSNTAWIGAPLARDSDGFARGCIYEFDVMSETQSAKPQPAAVYPSIGVLKRMPVFYPETYADTPVERVSFAVDKDMLAITKQRYWMDNEIQLYRREGSEWIHFQTLLPPDFPGYNFGSSIKINNNRMLVGPRGWMYEWEDGEWKYKNLITTGYFPTGIGYNSLDIQEDRVALAFAEEFYTAEQAGSVHTYHWSDGRWQLWDNIRPDPPIYFGNFGNKAILNGPILLIEVNKTGPTLQPQTLFYEYRNQKWLPNNTILYMKDPEDNGFNTIMQGQNVVQARWSNSPSNRPADEGKAYYYAWKNNGFILKQQIVEPDLPPYQFYGVGMAMDSNRLVIGAPGMKAVFFYELVDGKWVRRHRLDLKQLVLDPNDYFGFGTRIAIQGDTVVIGADLIDNRKNLNTVFVFNIEPLDSSAAN